MRIKEILKGSPYIIVNKKLANEIGLDAAVLYSELINRYYFFKITNKLSEDNTFYASIDDIEEATTLSRHKQNEALKKLIPDLVNKIEKNNNQRLFKICENDKSIAFLSELIGCKKLATSEDEGVKFQQPNEEEPVKNQQGDVNFQQAGCEKFTGRVQNFYNLNANEDSNNADSESCYNNYNNKDNNNINNNSIRNFIENSNKKIIDYYFDWFKKKYNKTHHNIKDMDKLNNLITDITGRFDLNQEQWEALIDYHFEESDINTDGGIFHFLSNKDGKYRIIESYIDKCFDLVPVGTKHINSSGQPDDKYNRFFDKIDRHKNNIFFHVYLNCYLSKIKSYHSPLSDIEINKVSEWIDNHNHYWKTIDELKSVINTFLDKSDNPTMINFINCKPIWFKQQFNICTDCDKKSETIISDAYNNRLCPECVEKRNKHICSECGNQVYDGSEINKSWVCQKCQDKETVDNEVVTLTDNWDLDENQSDLPF
jgi:hypothetical protein